MIAAYGIANLLQSIAATRTATTDSLDPGLLLRLFGHRTYLLGLLCQIFGFFFALAARRDLPLFLVQSAVTAGLCVTALLGVVLLKWRLPIAEIALLTLVVLGIGALAASAEPSKGEQIGPRGIITLIVALAVIAAGSIFAGRIKGVLGSVVLGSIAGLCFSSAAIAARPLAGAHSIAEFVLNPLLYLVIAHSLTGQLLLGLAMQRGSTNAAVAGMDAAGAVPAAVIGLVLLGDQMRPGLEWLAVLGFVVTLGAVIALTRYAEPQHELVAEPAPLPFRWRSASVPGLPEHPARGVVEIPDAVEACTTARTHVTIALQRPLRRPISAMLPGTGPAFVPAPLPTATASANGHSTPLPAATASANGHGTPVAATASAVAANGNGHPASALNGHSVNGHAGNVHVGQHNGNASGIGIGAAEKGAAAMGASGNGNAAATAANGNGHAAATATSGHVAGAATNGHVANGHIATASVNDHAGESNGHLGNGHAGESHGHAESGPHGHAGESNGAGNGGAAGGQPQQRLPQPAATPRP